MKISALLLFILLFVATAVATVTTTVSGKFQYPDGTNVNGRIEVSIVKPNIKDTCNGGRIVPLTKVVTQIRAGVLQTPLLLTPNECLSPTALYVVRIFDQQNTMLMEDNWYIGGTVGDVGKSQLVGAGPNGPIVVINPALLAPILSQTIAQPAGTIFKATEGTANNSIQLDGTGTTITGAIKSPSLVATNGILYIDSTGKIAVSATGGAGTLCNIETNGGPPTWGSCGGSASTNWGVLSNASQNMAINNGNFSSIITGGTTTPSGFFTIQDTTANSSVSPLVLFQTVGTSVALPLKVIAKGANGFQMDVNGILQQVGTGGISGQLIVPNTTFGAGSSFGWTMNAGDSSAFSITGGSGSTAGVAVNLTGGGGSTNGLGGNAFLTGGTGAGSGNGGSVGVAGGPSTTGVGGAVSVSGGSGQGGAGSATLKAGDPLVTNVDGANVILKPSTGASGTGHDGILQLFGGASTFIPAPVVDSTLHVYYNTTTQRTTCSENGTAFANCFIRTADFGNATWGSGAGFIWTMNAGDNAVFQVVGPAAVSAGNSGTAISITAGLGNGTGTGANLTAAAGQGGASGNGGAASLTGGAAGATTGNGGTATIAGGASTTAAGGAVNVTGGIGAGTNQVGGNINVSPGLGTGTSKPATLVVNGDAQGTASGTTTHSSVVRVAVNATKTGLATGVAASLVSTAFGTLPSGVGGHVIYSVEFSDGVDYCEVNGVTNYSIVDKAGVFSSAVSNAGEQTKCSGTATLTTAWATTAASPTVLTVTPTLANMGAVTTSRITYTVFNHSQQQATIQ